jgi:hypothetical protein
MTHVSPRVIALCGQFFEEQTLVALGSLAAPHATSQFERNWVSKFPTIGHLVVQTSIAFLLQNAQAGNGQPRP